MGVGAFRRIVAWVILGILFTQLTACGDGLLLTPTPAGHTYPVETIFKEFYQTLGGNETLGPTISPLQMRGDLQCQFAERALMCFNPAVTDENRFSLFPLGLELGIPTDVPVGNASPGGRVVDGYTIYGNFLPLYDRLYGARYAGRPLTELRINYDLRRVEQFFENVGFYQSLDDPNGPVSLIPYGAYLCGGDCSYQLTDYWSIVKSNTVEQPFAASIARLGGPSMTGPLLLKPQIAADGYLEQVYTNVVFYAPPADVSQVRLRPLPLMLGYTVEPLVAIYPHEQLVFYEIENGLGHNVPKPFDEFIMSHGGRDLAGKPISEVMALPGEPLYRQCFENYCLLYDPSAAEGMKVRIAPLGPEYLKQAPPPQSAEITNIFTPERISLLVSADKPNLPENETQTIRILVQNGDTGQPVDRVEATLILTYPDRPEARYTFPPTDSNGMSVLEIPPTPGLANGSRLAFTVCLNLPSDQPICVMDSYLIWSVQ
jgi:hypothetical protein